MANRFSNLGNLLTLLFIVGAAVAIWFYRAPLSQMYRQTMAYLLPCAVPIGYRLDRFDDQFGLTRTEFMATVQESANAWSTAAGKELFRLRPDGELDINLIYDYRQQATDQLQKMGLSIDSQKDTYNELKTEYDRRKTQVDQTRASLTADQAEFQSRLNAYNREIASWNAKGGAPEADYQRLEQEKQDLNDEAADLNQRNQQLNKDIEDLNAVVTVLNRVASNLNLEAEQYNQTVSDRGEKFQEGEYQRLADESDINIYEFENKEMMKRVLMHEFGHAIGLEHLSEDQAVMYELNSGQAAALSEADKQAISNHCRFTWPWER